MFIVITTNKGDVLNGYIKNPPLHTDQDILYLNLSISNKIHFREHGDYPIEYVRYIEINGINVKIDLLHLNCAVDPVESTYTLSTNSISVIENLI